MLKQFVGLITLIVSGINLTKSDTTTSSYGNPFDYNEFYRNVSRILCESEITNEQIASIKSNCHQYKDQKNYWPIIKCSGKSSLTDREKMTALCNETMLTCAIDLMGKMTTPYGYTTPTNIKEMVRSRRQEIIECLKKSLGKS